MKRIKSIIPGCQLCVIACVCLSCFLTGCSGIIRGYVNKKYPPVSSVAKSTEAVQQSIQQIQSLPQVDMGSKISKSFIDTVFRDYFVQMIGRDSTLGISGISKIQVIQYPELQLGRQELILTASLNFYLRDNKYVKSVQIDFSGRIAPSVIADSLILRPSFQRINIQKLKLTKWIFLGSAAKLAINVLCQSFMDNINGQIKNINLKINYPPLPEKSLSSILGNDNNIKVMNDYVFKLKRQMLTPVLLVEPQNILLITSIADNANAPIAGLNPSAAGTQLTSEDLRMPQPDYIIDRSGNMKFLVDRSAEGLPLSATAQENPAPPSFDELYSYLDTSFRKVWATNLDAIDYRDSVSVAVHMSYGAMSRIINELFSGVKFSLNYQLNIDKTFPEKAINLGEIQKPDCGNIGFDCQLNNCSNVLSDCGSCRWWDVVCQAKWTACQAFNGVKYTACQASNAAKLTWCAGELAARKTFCYTEIAAIFIYDNLVRPVGSFGGNASANGTITGEIDATTPGGISSLGLTGQIQTDINGAGSINFTPSGFFGALFVCNLPTVANFHLDHIHLSNPNFNLNATIQRKADNSGHYFNVSMNKLSLPIQLEEPFIVEILKNPQLILNCGTGILAGLSVLALKDNATFKQFLNVALKGSYNLEIQKDFNIYIPSIPVQVQQFQVSLNPTWGDKSLIFNNLK